MNSVARAVFAATSLSFVVFHAGCEDLRAGQTAGSQRPETNQEPRSGRLANVRAAEKPRPDRRVIEFATFEWEVKRSGSGPGHRVGPGPNHFSDSEENVFVDDDDATLHLVLLKRGDHFTCSEVIGPELGYGEYLFTIEGDFPSFHPSVVFAVFCYRSDTAEFDFELAKWNRKDQQAPNAQFVGGQPAGNDSLYRFHTGTARTLTVSMIWKEGFVRGRCWAGAAPVGAPLGSFTYTGPKVPKAKGVRVRSNLWVYRGQTPPNLKRHEVVIQSFRFKPDGGER